MSVIHAFSFIALLFGIAFAQCPDYTDYASQPHVPWSGGIHNISYQRPVPACRTWNDSFLERDVIFRVMNHTTDLDLFRLFLNSQYCLLITMISTDTP